MSTYDVAVHILKNPSTILEIDKIFENIFLFFSLGKEYGLYLSVLFHVSLFLFRRKTVGSMLQMVSFCVIIFLTCRSSG